MPTLEGSYHRLELVQSSDSVEDVLAPDSKFRLQRALSAVIDCGLFLGPVADDDTFVSSVANITSARLTVRKTDASGTVLIDTTTTSFSNISYANWANYTSRQFQFDLNDVDTNQHLPAKKPLPIYFAVTITTATRTFLAGSGIGEIVESGVVGAAFPMPPTLASTTVSGNLTVSGYLSATGSISTNGDLSAVDGVFSGSVTAPNIPPVFTPESFYLGTDPDDTLSFTRAISAASISGGKIELAQGKNYNVFGPIVVTGQGVVISASGIGTSIRNNSASGPTIQFGVDGGAQAAYCGVSNLRFDPGVTRNSGTYEIDCPNATNVSITDIQIMNVWGGIRLGTPSAIRAIAWINRVRAYNFHQLLYLVRFLDAWVSNVSSDAQNADAVDVILDGGVQSCNLTDSDFTGSGATNLVFRAVDYAPTSPPDPPSYNKIARCYFDGHGNGFLGSAGSTNSIDNCWFSNRPGSGVTLSGTIFHTRLNNCEAYGCAVHGFSVAGGTNTIFSNCATRNNTGNGFSVSAGVTGGVKIDGGAADGNQTNLFIDTGCSNVAVSNLRLRTPGVSDIINGSPDDTNVTQNDYGIFSASGKISATKGFLRPTSAGTAVFASDSSADAYVTIANNGTFQPFGALNNFSGVFFVNTLYDGNEAGFVTGGGNTFQFAGTTASMGITPNNAGTINVYVTGSVVTIQNKTGGSVQVKVIADRHRNGQ